MPVDPSIPSFTEWPTFSFHEWKSPERGTGALSVPQGIDGGGRADGVGGVLRF